MPVPQYGSVEEIVGIISAYKQPQCCFCCSATLFYVFEVLYLTRHKPTTHYSSSTENSEDGMGILRRQRLANSAIVMDTTPNPSLFLERCAMRLVRSEKYNFIVTLVTLFSTRLDKPQSERDAFQDPRFNWMSRHFDHVGGSSVGTYGAYRVCYAELTLARCYLQQWSLLFDGLLCAWALILVNLLDLQFRYLLLRYVYISSVLGASTQRYALMLSAAMLHLQYLRLTRNWRGLGGNEERRGDPRISMKEFAPHDAISTISPSSCDKVSGRGMRVK